MCPILSSPDVVNESHFPPSPHVFNVPYCPLVPMYPNLPYSPYSGCTQCVPFPQCTQCALCSLVLMYPMCTIAPLVPMFPQCSPVKYNLSVCLSFLVRRDKQDMRSSHFSQEVTVGNLGNIQVSILLKYYWTQYGAETKVV